MYREELDCKWHDFPPIWKALLYWEWKNIRRLAFSMSSAKWGRLRQDAPFGIQEGSRYFSTTVVGAPGVERAKRLEIGGCCSSLEANCHTIKPIAPEPISALLSDSRICYLSRVHRDDKNVVNSSGSRQQQESRNSSNRKWVSWCQLPAPLLSLLSKRDVMFTRDFFNQQEPWNFIFWRTLLCVTRSQELLKPQQVSNGKIMDMRKLFLT